jgi:hypothetical protein
MLLRELSLERDDALEGVWSVLPLEMDLVGLEAELLVDQLERELSDLELALCVPRDTRLFELDELLVLAVLPLDCDRLTGEGDCRYRLIEFEPAAPY